MTRQRLTPRKLLLSVLMGAVFSAVPFAAAADPPEPTGARLSEQPIPLDKTLERPPPLIELGAPFLGTGKLEKGFTLPGGAVWQPSLIIFGDYRTAVQAFSDGRRRVSEVANRLDVFANLQLTGTERVLMGFRPLDQNNRYFGYQFEKNPGFKRRFDGNLETLFFEGEFGELFPNLDLYDRHSLDYGFSIGRQPLLLQDGLLLDDTIDSIGLVRNSLHTKYTSGWRLDFLYGFNDVNRNNNRRDDSAQLLALSSSADFYWSTMDFDFVYVPAGSRTGDGLYGGFSGIQRVNIGNYTFNTVYRFVGSRALNHPSPQTTTGALLFTQVSYTPKGTLDWIYLDSFVAIDKFSSAARGPDAGGPLGRTGLLFEAVGLGRYGPPLHNDANHAIGFALGYQTFFAVFRRQLTIEFGGRKNTRGTKEDAIALAARGQQAIGRHFIVQIDGFVSGNRNEGTGYGGRTELKVKF